MRVLQEEPLFVIEAGEGPMEIPCPTAAVTILRGSGRWLTPGVHVFQAVAGRPEVRMVVERLEKDRYSVFVVLDSDPEDLLDAIFDAERELYSRSGGLPFDVRVMRPGPAWSPADLRTDSICHFDRADFHGHA